MEFLWSLYHTNRSSDLFVLYEFHLGFQKLTPEIGTPVKAPELYQWRQKFVSSAYKSVSQLYIFQYFLLTMKPTRIWKTIWSDLNISTIFKVKIQVCMYTYINTTFQK